MPPIITLTTDFGKRSHYAAALQGVIYDIEPNARIVEVSHEIPNYDVMEAAFVVKNMYRYFPKGSVHLIALDPELGENSTGVIMYCEEQWFVAPDNGICSLIAEHRAKSCYKIRTDKLDKRFPKSFRVGQYLAPVAALLAQQAAVETLGEAAEIKELIWGAPLHNERSIRGKIIHIDHFGNAITNIHRELFLEVRQERGFEIFLRNIRLKRIVSTYSDVGKADSLAIFGTSGYLEVAMREASAAELLGLKTHDMITVEFKE